MNANCPRSPLDPQMDIHLPSCRLTRSESRLWCRLALCILALAAIVGFATRLPGTHASDQARAVRRARLRQGLDLPKREFVPGEILVRFKPGTTDLQKLKAHALVNAQVLKRFDSVSHLERVRLPDGARVDEAVTNYRAQADVLYAEPNYVVHTIQNLTLPNDPRFSQQWNLHNTGQNGGTAGADIHAPEAWNVTKGSASVVLALIDTGVDYTHPDLSSQIWSAPTPFTVTRTQGDVFTCPAGSRGFNAVAGTCDPADDVGHGTHVAGIMGAATNNAIGVAGINWNVQILPCKFLNSQGFGDVGGAITCLDMVKSLKDSGINIIASNNSWSGGSFSQSLSDAIAAQQQSGLLFIAAAGNDFLDNDLVPGYPADYGLPNIISVAASTNKDEFAAFSNVGRRTTHLTAPGDQILSTTPNNTYSVISGTSMAAPHVTGVAALLKAQDSSRDWRAIKNLLLSGGDTVAALDSTITGKRLNAAGSLNCSNQTVQSRLLPLGDTISASVGAPVNLAALSINCGQAAGPISVTVSPGGQTVILADDGVAPDQAAGDGIFSAQWTPPSTGSYVLTFPWGDAVQVEVLSSNYSFQSVSPSYVNIAGTDLDLGDDSVASVSSPFPISYARGSFTQVFISSNGTISFTDAFSDYHVGPLPPEIFPPFAVPPPVTLVAPFWQDLFPVKGSSQNVFWAVVGAAPNRQFVVEWRDVRSFLCRSDASATVRFQVVFFEGKSDVQFNYADTVFGGNCTAQDNGAAATVGLQESLTAAQTFSFREAAVWSGTSMLWTIPSSPPSPNPLPVVNSVSPSSAVIGGPGFTLTVNGSNFMLGSRVNFSGVDRPTTFVSSTQLTAPVDASELVPPFFFFGPAQVSVINPPPGGGTSAQLPFTFLNPVPAINSISPPTVTAAGLSFSLRVNGTGFNGGTVLWNGTPLQSFSSDLNTIFAFVPFGLIANAGTAQITVSVSPPGGGTSNAVPLTISPAPAGSAPLLSSSLAASPQEQQQRRLSLDNRGRVQAQSGSVPPRPMRFMGWNYGRKMGPAYLKHFARPHRGTALPLANSTTTSVSPNLKSLAAPAVTFGAPGTLPGFDLRKPLPADFIPTSVATGDFNKDGKLDWVVSNGGSNNLWLYLGKGDGTAQLPIILPLKGAAPLQVVAADLRHSGILDLIVAEADSATVGVLLGNGDGTFQPETLYYAPAPVLSLAAGDFDGDGKIDVVAGLLGDAVTGPLAFLRGDGAGHLGSPVTRPPENSVGSFATVTLQAFDFNGDGLPDLLMNDEGGVLPGIHVYLNHGEGTFKESVYLFEAGPFVQPLNAIAGNLNESGCPDIAVSTDAGSVYVFNGHCDGTFDGFPNVFLVGAGDVGAGIALADVDGDGHLDVITAGIDFDVSLFGPETGNAVAVLRGDGHGALSPGKIYRGETGMFSVAVGDLNGDGHPDLITSNQDSDTTSVYLNDAKGGFGDPRGAYIGDANDGVTGGSINNPFCCPMVSDINGDGKPDIAYIMYWKNFQNPWRIAVLLNDGTGHFGAPIVSDAFEGTFQIYDVRLADVRGLGRPDLLILGSDINSSFGYLGFAPNMGGGTFGPVKITKLNQGPGIFTVGDFNGDGKPDLAIGRGSGRPDLIDRISVMLGNGDGTFRPGADLDFGPAGSTGGGPRRMVTADFNHDGKLDLLIAVNDNVVGPGSLPHPLFEFLGRGDGTFLPPTTLTAESVLFDVADVNHDGLPDIIEQTFPITIQGFQVPTFKVLLGRPDGTFQDGATYSPFAGLSNTVLGLRGTPLEFPGLLLGDFNGDGNIDIAVPQFGDGFNQVTFSRAPSYMQFLLGNGDGTFTPDYAVHDFGKVPLPTVVADLNGDGRDDLIEIDPWPSSYNILLSIPGSAIQARLVADPVIGNKGTLRINLAVVAASATTVQLSASDPAISLPSSVTIASASISQDVPFTIGAGYNSAHVFSLQATLGSDVAVAYGTQASPAQNLGFHLYINNPTESTPPGGATQDYGLGAASINGYATTLSFSCQGLPTGASCIFTPSTLNLAPNFFAGIITTVQVANGTPLGSYPFTIVASDGAITSQVAATLGVSDFSLSILPASRIAFPGQGASYTLTVTPLNGWSQGVQLSCPVTPPGPKCSLDSAFVQPGQTAVNIDPQAAPVGNYSFTVSGASSRVSHSASAQLKIEDATIAMSKTAATVSVGSSTNVNVTLTSSNGFTDQFTFACLNAPAGVACSFSPSSGQLPANGTLTSDLTVQVNSRPTSGAAYLRFTPSSRVPGRAQYLAGMVLALLLAALLATKRGTGRFELAWARAICSFTIFLLAFLSACGGGGSSSSPPPPPPPPQSVTIILQVQATSPSLTRTSGSLTITIP